MQGTSTPRPLAVKVRDLYKRFRLPGHRPETFKERAIHPFRPSSVHRELKVLNGISFELERGRFLGILGRNGSGKSTLLKLLASIYRADSGDIWVSGRLAPVIELGVGFQPELPARENVILNGLMMGLSQVESARRYDAVIDYAELGDFVDLKLKNYSSGMRVRLAFAVMLYSDPDILLLDEVLAVGDLAFQRRCEETFRDLRASGDKTIILVTNQPGKLAQNCDQAILLEGGKIEASGQPDQVARRYEEVLSRSRDAEQPPSVVEGADRARVTSLRLAWGEADGDFDRNGEIRLRATVEANADIPRPGFRVQIRTEENATVFFPPSVELLEQGAVSAGDRFAVETVIENKLAPGRYRVFCAVTDHRDRGPAMVSMPASEPFTVRRRGRLNQGVVALEHEIKTIPGED
jgi:ABC-type polysaccharide/polyol phosphate transport system ATPase subunit